ncbi:MAG: hypothetical protein AB1342_13255 [Pseudomonadota bacterium]
MSRSTHILLGLGLAGLIAETVISHPALTVDKVKLFKVTTSNSEFVVGLTKDELARLHTSDAASLAQVLQNGGAMNAWQYAVRRGAGGEQEEAPVKKIVLTSDASMRIEAYRAQMRVVPIAEVRMAQAAE